MGIVMCTAHKYIHDLTCARTLYVLEFIVNAFSNISLILDIV